MQMVVCIQGKVLVWRGDITQLAADAIVNAANEAHGLAPLQDPQWLHTINC